MSCKYCLVVLLSDTELYEGLLHFLHFAEKLISLHCMTASLIVGSTLRRRDTSLATLQIARQSHGQYTSTYVYKHLTWHIASLQHGLVNWQDTASLRLCR